METIWFIPCHSVWHIIFSKMATAIYLDPHALPGPILISPPKTWVGLWSPQLVEGGRSNAMWFSRLDGHFLPALSLSLPLSVSPPLSFFSLSVLLSLSRSRSCFISMLTFHSWNPAAMLQGSPNQRKQRDHIKKPMRTEIEALSQQPA